MAAKLLFRSSMKSINFRNERSLFLVNLPCNTTIILKESKEYTNILYLPIADSCGLQSIPEHLV